MTGPRDGSVARVTVQKAMMQRFAAMQRAARWRWAVLPTLALLALAAMLGGCTEEPALRSEAAQAARPAAGGAPVSITTQRRVALVIGNGAYRHNKVLPNPARDARLMAQVLRRAGFDVIPGIDRTKQQMDGLLREFSNRLQGGQLGVVFYAGHGMEVDGENWLLPVDANPSNRGDLEFVAISLAQVQRVAEGAASTNLILLDACRDNPLARRFAGLGRSRSSGEPGGLAAVQVTPLTRASRTPGRGGGRGLGEGTLIAFATAPNTTAEDGEGKANSPFTTALAQHLTTPGLDIRLAMGRVREAVIAATDRKQIPWDTSSLTTEVVLVPAVATQVIDQPAAPPQGPPTVPAPSPRAKTTISQGIVATQPVAMPLQLPAALGGVY